MSSPSLPRLVLRGVSAGGPGLTHLPRRLPAFSQQHCCGGSGSPCPPTGAEFILRFHRWSCQSRELFKPLHCKVLLAIDNIPTHLWLMEIVQTIIGLAYQSFKLALASTNKEDMSQFFIVAWAMHPNHIPNDMGCAIPESEERLTGLPPSSLAKWRSFIQRKIRSSFVPSFRC
jgi:hypothetical protein